MKKYKIDGFNIKNGGEIDVRFSFHDAVFLNDDLVEDDLKGKKLILKLDIEGGFTSFNTIVFNDYIVKQNAHIKDVWCLYSNFYIKDNGRYEAVFETEYFKPKKTNEIFIINAKSIDFIEEKSSYNTEKIEFPAQYKKNI